MIRFKLVKSVRIGSDPLEPLLSLLNRKKIKASFNVYRSTFVQIEKLVSKLILIEYTAYRFLKVFASQVKNGMDMLNLVQGRIQN